MKPAHLSNSLVFLILPALGYAAPASATTQHQARDVKITATQIETIAPKSKSCADAPARGECATSEQAAANIAKSFETYKVTSAAEQAAVIGLMAFESLDFEYNRNHFPGVAGQGSMFALVFSFFFFYDSYFCKRKVDPDVDSPEYAIACIQCQVCGFSASSCRQVEGRVWRSGGCP